MNSSPHNAKKQAASDQEAAVTSDSNYRTDQSTATAEVNTTTTKAQISITPSTPAAVDFEISMVASILIKERPAEVSFRAVLDQIRRGEWASEITEIRKVHAQQGKQIARPFKERLPAILLSGTFSRKRTEGLIAHSGLICADLDNLGDELASLKQTITADPHTLACFVSPSGNGLKVVLRCDPNRDHKESFAAVERCSENFEVQIDKSCSDVSRPCFVSHDPDLFQRADSPLIPYSDEEFPAKSPVKQPTLPKVENEGVLPMPPDLGSFTKEEVRQMLASIPPRPDYPEWLKISSAVYSTLPYRDALEVLNEWSPEETPGEYKNKYHHRLTEVGAGTLVHYAVQNGFVLPKVAIKAPGDVVILPGGEVTITQCANDLFSRIANKEDLFFRGGRVHEVLPDANATLNLAPLSSTQFRSRMERYCSLFVWRVRANGEKVLKPTVCPEETAKALLESEPARRLLPNIALITACPVLLRDAIDYRIIGRGWHQDNGGIFIGGGETPLDVPLREAVKALEEVLSDFNFSTPGDQSRALASLIGPAMKFGGWIDSQLPIDVAEADHSQAGKGYRQKCTAAIYRETPNLVTQKSGGVGGMDESISQKLIDGRPFVLLDNLRGPLNSPFLEAILTAPGSMERACLIEGKFK